jgi:hypothetical protein
MTPTRWAIVTFWVLVVLAGAYYALDYSMVPAPPPAPEQHWFPPPLPGSQPPPRPPDADVKLTHYVAHITPGAPTFSVDETVENQGSKKATGVEVVVHPYIGNQDTNKKEYGPDEIPGQQGGDPMANVVQSLGYPDLDPGQTATQSFTLPMRTDADPSQRDDKPQIIFQTANP